MKTTIGKIYSCNIMLLLFSFFIPFNGAGQIVKMKPTSKYEMTDSIYKVVKHMISGVSVGRTYHFWVDIEAGQQKVFDKISTVEGLNSWLTDEASVMKSAGGTIEYVWDFGKDKLQGIATFVRAVPPFVFKIQFDQWIDPKNYLRKPARSNPFILPFEMTYTCKANGPGRTILSLSTYCIQGSKEYDEYFLASKSGWLRSLANLKSVCETGVDMRGYLNGSTLKID